MWGWRLVLPLVSYFASGIGLTCFNKYLLGSASYDFGFPVTLILCHMLTNFFLSCVSLLSLRVPLIAAAFPSLSSLSSSSSSSFHPSSSSGPSSATPAPLTSSSYYPSRLPFRLFLRRFVPIGVLFAIDITLTNVSFRLVPVSLTEVVKGLAPAALMLYSWRMDRMRAEQRSELGVPAVAAVAGGWWAKASVIVLLSGGIALTSYGELNFRWNGFLAALGALVAGVVKFVLLERLLEEEEDDGRQEGGEGEVNGSKKAGEASNGKASGGEAAGDREAEGEEAAGEVEKSGKKRGHYQQVLATADDDDDQPHTTNHTNQNNHNNDNNNQSDTLPSVRIDTPTDSEASTSVTVSLKPMDEETKEGSADMDSADREGRTLHKVNDIAPPLRRRSPVTASVRHSSVELAAMENGEEPTNFVLSARPASPNIPFITSDLPSTAVSSSSFSSLKPSPSTSSVSGNRIGRRPAGRLHPSSHKRLHPLLSLFYFSPVAALVLVPTFFRLEWTALLHPAADATSFVASPAVVYHTLGLILLSAVMAFALNLSELSLIQSTSALTLCVVSTVKFLLVVVLTSVLFEHEVSVVNAVGCCVSAVGVGGYNWIKYREFEQQRVGQETIEEAGGEHAQLMNSKR